MDITTIPAVRGARHRQKRVGRGIGSGHGKTSTRGQKGQRSRTGEGKRPGFVGGRTPLIRRLPKRGGKYKATPLPVKPQILNVAQLNRFEDGARVTLEQLVHLKLVDPGRRVKLLGDGEVSKRLTVVVHQASASAKTKLAKAGGTVEVISAG